jgi:hypothetical protein
VGWLGNVPLRGWGCRPADDRSSPRLPGPPAPTDDVGLRRVTTKGLTTASTPRQPTTVHVALPLLPLRLLPLQTDTCGCLQQRQHANPARHSLPSVLHTANIAPRRSAQPGPCPEPAVA